MSNSPEDLKATQLPDGSFSVLKDQAEPIKPITLDSPFVGIKPPTDLEPVSVEKIESISETAKPSRVEGRDLESFKINYRVLSEIDVLISRATSELDKKVLREIRHELYYAESVNRADEILNNAFKDNENIFGKRYKDVRSLLYQTSGLALPADYVPIESTPSVDLPIPTIKLEIEKTIAPEILNGPIDVEVHAPSATIKTELPLNEETGQGGVTAEPAGEISLEKEAELFVVPLGLTAFIGDLSLGGADVDSLSDLLKGAKSTEEVRDYLKSANFYEKLSNSQYQKAINLLGLEDDSVKISSEKEFISPLISAQQENEMEAVLTDADRGRLAVEACKSGDYDQSIENVKRIQDANHQMGVISEILEILVSKDYLQIAYEFVELIKNERRRREMIVYLSNRQSHDNGDTDIVDKARIDEIETTLRKNETEVVDSPKPDLDVSTEIVKDINIELAQARSEYAEQLIAWKNKNREKKNKFARLLSDLGVEKQMPEDLKPPELRDAEEAYIQAKKEKVRAVTGGVGSIIHQAEVEYADLQQKILDSVPTIESNRIAKAMEKWAKFPLPARIALTTTLMIGAGLAFSTVAVGGIGATLAYRGMRSLGGAVIGQEVGAMAGDVMERSSRIRKREAGESYGREMQIDLSNFEEKEKELMRFYEREENQIKRNRLKKAGVMMAVGAGVNISGDLLLKGLSGDISSSVSRPRTGGLSETTRTGIKVPEPSKPDGLVIDKLTERPKVIITEASEIKAPNAIPLKELKLKVELSPESAVYPKIDSVKIPEASADIKVVTEMPKTQVELSSRGFLQDIHNLKAKIIADAGGDMDKVPDSVKYNILNKPTVEIAKEYGFWDLKNNTSAMGLRGEHLGVDDQGHLVLDHGGKVDAMVDVKTGDAKTFEEVGGKMFTPEPEMVKVKAEFIDTGSKTGYNPEPENTTFPPVDVPDEPSVKVTSDLEASRTFSAADTMPNGPEIQIMDIDTATSGGGGKAMIYNGTVVAHERMFGGGKILALDDKFQEGAQFKDVREAFNTAFEKNFRETIGGKPTVTPFEGGKIYVVYGTETEPESIKILLNGKEIAKGFMETKGDVVGPKLSFDSTLKGGWFLADNAYERAFKHTKKFLGLK